MKNNRIKLFLLITAFLVTLAPFAISEKYPQIVAAWAPPDFMNKAGQIDHNSGYVVEIKDREGNIISKAARGVVAGDEIINSDGKHYRVVSVTGNQATAEFTGMDQQFLAYNEYFANVEVPVSNLTAEQKRQIIGVYHTHSDESYVPTDGTEAIPFKGGIYQVGQSLVNKLRNEKVSVDYDKTPHDPHDNNAYYRSRRTAANLMKNNPIALLDIHRDGIPDPDYYRKNVSNEDVAQLRIVIGRQNPKMDSNLDFAKRMMAYANNVHPKIVKEIFMANGNYNQDLMSTALLIEAGTHTNTRDEAERGVALFADAIPTVLGITTAPPGGGGAAATKNTGTWKALAWVLGLLVIGGGAFLLVSSGGLKQAGQRLSSYVGREFTGFFGPVGRVWRKRNSGEITGSKDAQYKPDENEIDRDNKKRID
ncbi:MAG: stage II sporulation protein P [Bacillota bacterium]